MTKTSRNQHPNIIHGSQENVLHASFGDFKADSISLPNMGSEPEPNPIWKPKSDHGSWIFTEAFQY